MNDAPSIGAEARVEGITYIRLASLPNGIIDNQIDPFNSRQFVDKTNKNGIYGDLIDRSAELSRKRAEKRDGVDPLRKRWEDNYSKIRNGKKPPPRDY